ncbi:hypothetical protein RN001_004983 [Aquatica leii]|uniref:Uncharacterized protein n=1 Tax=Aquatica leii TaxID=1421715 RepID=A0AAN7PC16_9COLE|nr:hypothetical protein RN001_004983 [Aquatica leii]
MYIPVYTYNQILKFWLNKYLGIKKICDVTAKMLRDRYFLRKLEMDLVTVSGLRIKSRSPIYWIFGFIFLLEVVLGQYVHHPLGAVSFSQNTFYEPHGYNYVAPSGQKVNVYFGSRLHRVPLAHNYNQPLFHNGWLLQRSNAPSAKSLFKPANVGDASATNKQIEAYNDYVKELWKEEQEDDDSITNTFEY